MDRFDNIGALISNTPMVIIHYRYKGETRRIFAKPEFYNISGSIKDRVAYYILKKAYANGSIRRGDMIAEATSGNTGIAFCALGAYLGHPVTIFMPDWMSRERINLMKSYGAKVRLVSKEEGGFLGSIKMCEELAKGGGVFLPQQFENVENINAHIEDTGAEILRQLDSIGAVPSGVIAGVGTGGTIMGLARALRSRWPAVKAFPLEPSASPTLSTGTKVGSHKIQGISDEFIPPIVNLRELDEVVGVDDIDSILMARKLAETLGLGVGISSGANFIGAVKTGLDNMVTVFADDNKKYLSTDYTKDWPVKEEYISAGVEILGCESIK